MAPRMRFELMLPKKPVFKTGAVIRAWLPRLSMPPLEMPFKLLVVVGL